MARLSELGIDFDHWCFACGRANPYGLHLDFDVARGRAETTLVSRREHTGYDGFVHGGIVTALLDETMGWAIFHQGIWGVTARLAVSFRRPVPVGEPLTVRAEVKKETRRAVDIHGEVLDSAGTLLADAEGTFVVMPEQRRRELERRYGRARTKPAPEATGEDERRLEERSDYSRIDEAFTKVREAVAAEEKQREQEEGPLFSRAERGVRT